METRFIKTFIAAWEKDYNSSHIEDKALAGRPELSDTACANIDVDNTFLQMLNEDAHKNFFVSGVKIFENLLRAEIQTYLIEKNPDNLKTVRFLIMICKHPRLCLRHKGRWQLLLPLLNGFDQNS